MKQILVILTALLLAFGGKELRVLTVTTTPEMHCQNCEKKIKENIRFEAGVKRIETSIEKQLVTITYDPAKTDPQQLAKAFAKIGYSIKVVGDQPATDSRKLKKQAR